MKTNTLIVITCFFACLSVSGQTSEYKKFSLSVRAGMDYPIGTANTGGIDPDFMLPFSRGFGGTFDGVYYFTKNYGAGLKYHLFSAKGKGNDMVLSDKLVEFSFKETAHFIGPALYARWSAGQTKWEIPVSISVGYIHNKLSDQTENVYYKREYPPLDPCR